MTNLSSKKKKAKTIKVDTTPIAELPTPVVHKLPQLGARSWVTQPDIELGLHPSVSATIKALAADKGELLKRLTENAIIHSRVAAEQIKFYGLNFDNSRSLTFSDDCAIMKVPQPPKLKTEDIA